MSEDFMMQTSYEMAKKAFSEGEVPVGAALFHKKTGALIAKGHNETLALCDPTAHAEMLVIKKACKVLETTHLNDYVLVTTLEPCAMCATACAHAKVGEIRFGAYDVKSGGTVNGARIFNQQTCHHKPEVYGGIMEGICSELLREFFKKKRGLGPV
ncbi:MAG: tRNA(adenine34) deaminase [bacterium]